MAAGWGYFGRALVPGFASILLVCGCAGKPEPRPFAAPGIELSSAVFAGSSLSGPTTRPATVPDLSASPLAGITVLAMEADPAGLGKPFGAEARLVAAMRGGAPVLPTARLTRDARIVDLPTTPVSLELVGAGRVAEAGRSQALLPAGITAAFSVGPPPIDPYALDPLSRRIELALRRAGGNAVEISLLVDDAPPVSPDPTGENGHAAPAPPPTTRPALTREIAVVQRDLPAEGLRFLLIVPMRFDAAAAIGIYVEIAPPPGGPPQAEAADACLAALRESDRIYAARPRIAVLEIAAAPGFAAALAAVNDPATRRAALVFLASQGSAAIAEDFALIANDALLTDFALRLGAIDMSAADTPLLMGWVLDREAVALMAAKLDEDALPPALSALLLRHAGEAGRRASSLQEAIRASSNAVEFQNRLVAENYISLEDASPAARVRAYDWLAGRQRAPAGYDPLGPPRQRRAALVKALYDAPKGGNP